MNIHTLTATHVGLTGLFTMLNDLVSEAEIIYLKSGKADDKMRLHDMLQARSALVEAMCHFARAGGAAIVPPGKTGANENLNANGEAF